MKSDLVRIGTRGSDLALSQAHWVERELKRRHTTIDVQICIVKTQGDKVLDSPLSSIGDKGLFTKEIEDALLANDIDLAVHSLKDLPTELPDGLTIGAIGEREDPRDVFIPHPANPKSALLDQPFGARIATGSLRRTCQVLCVRPDFQIMDIRGNVNTRIKKLEESNWSGMILAYAGIARLGLLEKIGEIISPEIILPAVGQGALALEVRDGDNKTRDLLMALHHPQTASATSAERALLRSLKGGCQIPVGVYARIEKESAGRDTLILDAMVGSLDGKTIVRGSRSGSTSDAELIGQKLAENLLAKGADVILRQIRDAVPPSVDRINV